MRHSTSRQVGTAVRPDRLPIEERLDLGRLLRAKVELGRPDDPFDLARPPRPHDGAGYGAWTAAGFPSIKPEDGNRKASDTKR